MPPALPWALLTLWLSNPCTEPSRGFLFSRTHSSLLSLLKAQGSIQRRGKATDLLGAGFQQVTSCLRFPHTSTHILPNQASDFRLHTVWNHYLLPSQPHRWQKQLTSFSFRKLKTSIILFPWLHYNRKIQHLLLILLFALTFLPMPDYSKLSLPWVTEGQQTKQTPVSFTSDLTLHIKRGQGGGGFMCMF